MNVIPEIARGAQNYIYSPYVDSFDPVKLASQYEGLGVDTVCLRTYSLNFGSRKWIKEVKENTALTVIARDYPRKRSDIEHLKLAGADKVILSVSLMPISDLGDLVAYCSVCQMIPILEVNDLASINAATMIAYSKVIRDFGLVDSILINNTNHQNTTVHKTLILSERVPQIFNYVLSIEGITKVEEVQKLKRRGINEVIINEALIFGENPLELLSNMQKV